MPERGDIDMKALTPRPVTLAVLQSGIALVQPAYRGVILFLTWLALLICFVDRLAWGNVALDVGRALNMQMNGARRVRDGVLCRLRAFECGPERYQGRSSCLVTANAVNLCSVFIVRVRRL